MAGRILLVRHGLSAHAHRGAGRYAEARTVAEQGTYVRLDGGAEVFAYGHRPDMLALVISDVTSDGTITVNGVSQPFADSFSGGTVAYHLVGDELHITFDGGAAVGEVTHTYTRP